MSTRASAPRCASCGMPLAPEATACGVCGARVPLIARPADEPEGVVAGSGSGSGARAEGTATTSSHGPAAPGGPTVPGRSPAVDPALRARAAVTDAARRVSPGPPLVTRTAPSIGARVLAYAIDVLLLLAVAGLVQVLPASGGSRTLVALVAAAAVWLAQVVAEGRHGTTVGAAVLGLRTVDAATGEAPGMGRALVRQVLVALGVLGCGVGNWLVTASGVWDPSPWRRGWHDRASGTLVVRAAARHSVTAAPVRRSAPEPLGPPAAATALPAAPPGVIAATPGATVVTPEVTVATTAPTPVPVPTTAPTALVLPPPGSSTWETSQAPGAPGAGWPWAVRGDDDAPEDGVVRDAPGTPVPGPAAEPSPEPGTDLLPPPPTSSSRTPVPPPALVAPQGLDTLQGLDAPQGLDTPQGLDAELVELEHTRVRDPEQLRRRIGTLALSFDTGERVRVVGRGLVGRGPRAEDGTDILHVVTLHDGARSLSRVHLEFGPERGGEDEPGAVWVVDRGSTNGTVLVDPTGAARVLPAGTRAVVRAGWTLRLGSREARVEDD